MKQGVLEDIISFANGKSIKPGGEGIYPAFGANGIIGGSDEFNHEDAIILGRVGAYCGAVEKCNEKFWASDNTIVVRPKAENFSKLYTYHLLKYLDLNKYAGGSAQPLLTQTTLKKVPVSFHESKKERDQVGELLAEYDNLIENNNRRIAILEDMAQSLYREWFIKFRFPGHENCEFIDSALGRIPEGWEEKTIADVAKVKGGKRLPKGKKVLDDETPYPYLRVKDLGENGVDRSGIKFIDEESHLATQRYIITTEDVYVSIAGTIGRVGIVPDKFNNAHLTENAAKITDINQPMLLHYIHRYLHSDAGRKLLVSRASGSSQPKLALYKIAELPLLIPSESVLMGFNKCQMSISALIHSLENKNENLIGQRDMLLPKLISGNIAV